MRCGLLNVGAVVIAELLDGGSIIDTGLRHNGSVTRAHLTQFDGVATSTLARLSMVAHPCLMNIEVVERSVLQCGRCIVLTGLSDVRQVLHPSLFKRRLIMKAVLSNQTHVTEVG